jgi:hypothetical protein
MNQPPKPAKPIPTDYDIFFAMRNNPFLKGNDVIEEIKRNIGFLGNYTDMILPDDCRGNLLLLINLLFCDDHGSSLMTPTTHSFCTDRFIPKVEKMEKLPKDLLAETPGAFKEVVRFFLTAEKTKLEVDMLRDAKQLLLQENKLERHNPIVESVV